MKPTIVVCSGLIGSGKTTVAKMLAQSYGFERESMALPVRQTAANVFGFPYEMLIRDDEMARSWKEQPDPYWTHVLGRPFSPRIAMQEIGTELFRNGIHHDVWVHSMRLRIDSSPSKRLVFDDVRFINEMEALASKGATFICITRQSKIPPKIDPRVLDPQIGGEMRATLIDAARDAGVHESELNWLYRLEDYDHFITNDGTPEELLSKIDDLMKGLL